LKRWDGSADQGGVLSSTFTWLDYSERERRRVRDVLEVFREQETIDELGIGTLREAFADLLFPGTSTVMTRARYFLFVPWIYLRLERSHVPAARFAARLREDELRLMRALLDTGETEGIIGRVARNRLQRLPSNIYWQGLGVWGIRLFPGGQTDYQRTIESFYASVRQTLATREDESDEFGTRRNWHAGLPSIPDAFPGTASIHLRRIDAEYLCERISSARARTGEESLLAFLARSEEPDVADYVWEVSQVLDAPAHIADWLVHLRAFSEVMHGAALLYNLMLAQLDGREERIEEYEARLATWRETLDRRQSELATWDRDAFWALVRASGARAGERTRTFVDAWLDLAIVEKTRPDLTESTEARALIRARERQLKGGRARLVNKRALENWSGWSGASQMAYRWGIASRLLGDIHEGLRADA
jgi:hypothetical protein